MEILELKNRITEIKSWVNVLNRRLDPTKESINILKNRSPENV